MDDLFSWRLWTTALLLGFWVVCSRAWAQPRLRTRQEKINGVMLSMTACVLTMLYYWKDMANTEPSRLLFYAGGAAFIGSDIPRLRDVFFELWKK